MKRCMKCMFKACRQCSTSSCRGYLLLISTLGVPTWDGIKYALSGKESGLSRNQISQVFSCPYFTLGKILGQMLEAKLILVLDAYDETRYCLQQGPPDNSTSASASEVTHCGTFYERHDPDSSYLVSQCPTEPSAEAELIRDFSSRASTALDALARICDHLLTHKEHSPACFLLQGPLYISEARQKVIDYAYAKYHSIPFEKWLTMSQVFEFFQKRERQSKVEEVYMPLQVFPHTR